MTTGKKFVSHSRFPFEFFEDSRHFFCSDCFNFLNAIQSFNRGRSSESLPGILGFTSGATPANLCPMSVESHPISCELNSVALLPDCAFICDNGKCLLDDKEKCDGVDNCGDYSDELKPCSEYIMISDFCR